MNPVRLKGERTGIVVLIEPGTTPAQAAAALADRLRVHHRLYRGAQFFLAAEAAQQPDLVAALRAVFAQYPELTLVDQPAAVAITSEPLLLRETLRSGESIRHCGDVVVWGNVNEGAEIVATGNVYVRGTIFGKVHAGAAGDAAAVIRADMLQPTQLRIANVIGLVNRPRRIQYRRRRPGTAQTARIVDGTILIECDA